MQQNNVLGSRMWIVILMVLAVMAVPFTLLGFKLGGAVIASRLKIPFIGVIVGRIAMCRREIRRIGGMIDGIFQFSAVALVCVAGVYMATAGNRPLADAGLLAIDRFIGYDWLAYARFCARHAIVLKILKLCYHSMLVQPAALAALLYLTDRVERYEIFIIAVMISALLTTGIFYLWPATTAWTYLGQNGVASATLPDLVSSSRGWIGELLRLRHGGSRVMDSALGIVAFPSFHCVLAISFVWVAWPVKAVRIPFLVLNMIMIASAPIVGGHYVADLLCGALVACVAIVAARKLHGLLCGLQWTPLARPAFARVLARPGVRALDS